MSAFAPLLQSFFTDRLIGQRDASANTITQKERAIGRVAPPSTTTGRYKPSDPLLAFLETL